MDTRLLEYFLTVVHEGSIMGAAKVLHQSQPPLSRSITRLERELGVQLLVRSKRGVTPTPAGEYLVQEGRRLMTTMQSVERHLRNMQSGLEGHVSIASIPALTWDVLPPILQRFTAETPRAEITLSTVSPLSVIDALMSKAADVGLLAIHDVRHLDDEVRRSVDMIPVGGTISRQMSIAMPVRLANLPDPVDLRDLQDELWIVPFRSSRVPSLRELAEDVWREAGLHYPRIHEVSMMHAGLPLISAGLGVGLFSQTRHVDNEDSFVLRRPLQRIPALDLLLLWRKERMTSPIITRFVECARAVSEPGAINDQRSVTE